MSLKPFEQSIHPTFDQHPFNVCNVTFAGSTPRGGQGKSLKLEEKGIEFRILFMSRYIQAFFTIASFTAFVNNRTETEENGQILFT